MIVEVGKNATSCPDCGAVVLHRHLAKHIASHDKK